MLHSWVDPSIVFYICTYKDLHLLENCLKNLRKSYPTSCVIVVSDGDKNKDIKFVCEQFNCRFFLSRWMYGIKSGGKRHQRMLRLFLKTSGEYLIKIDTDTLIKRKIGKLPKTGCCFGTIIRNFIQGGCIGYTRDVAQKLYNSGVFLNRELCKPETWCELSKWRIKAGLISEDQINGYCLRELNIPMINHYDIRCYGKFRGDNDGFAVIHPSFESKLNKWNRSCGNKQE